MNNQGGASLGAYAPYAPGISFTVTAGTMQYSTYQTVNPGYMSDINSLSLSKFGRLASDASLLLCPAAT